MHLIRRLPECSDQPMAVAIGNFDGLHRGHQAVITAMVKAAQARDLLPGVLTFEPHPRRFFQPDVAPFRIERLRTKLARLEQAGVARIVMPKFDATFTRITAQDFLDDVLGRRLNAKAVVTGENFAFGHQRQGTSAMLQAWGIQHHVEIITVPPVITPPKMGPELVCSSSAARAAIAAGDMTLTARILGRSYMISGRVIHGDGRGATLGFPTANVALPPGLMLPVYGVYAVHASVGDATFKGVANLGIRPTIGGYQQPSLEVHLFDFKQDIYGKTMRVFFVKHLRHEVTFDGMDSLVKQITHDCELARHLMGSIG